MEINKSKLNVGDYVFFTYNNNIFYGPIKKISNMYSFSTLINESLYHYFFNLGDEEIWILSSCIFDTLDSARKYLKELEIIDKKNKKRKKKNEDDYDDYEDEEIVKRTYGEFDYWSNDNERVFAEINNTIVHTELVTINYLGSTTNPYELFDKTNMIFESKDSSPKVEYYLEFKKVCYKCETPYKSYAIFKTLEDLIKFHNEHSDNKLDLNKFLD